MPAPPVRRPNRLQELATLGVKTPFSGLMASDSAFILALGGQAMEGVEFGAGKPVVPDQLDDNDPIRPVILDFDKRMKERYGMGNRPVLRPWP